MPLVLRMCEKYVSVLEEGWRVRYSRISESSVCSYVRVMCWLWRYYSSEVSECCVWYEGLMSPLLCDVIEKIGVCSEMLESDRLGECSGCRKGKECSLCNMEVSCQLKYVLPSSVYKECGVSKRLEKCRSCEEVSVSVSVLGSGSVSVSVSGLLCNYEWAFNEYFWECVPRLEKISIETLEKWNERSKEKVCKI